MHRTPLGVLAAALALVIAALATPSGDANDDASATGTTSAAVARVPVSLVAQVEQVKQSAEATGGQTAQVPTQVPTQYSRPVRACRSGLVALTFDDGPSASVTMGLVRTLRRLEVPATFFMVGSRVRSSPQIARQVQRAGFQIANHSWTHANLTAVRSRDVRSELRRTQQEFVRQRVVAASLMRPPYGAINPRVRRDVRSLGLRPVLWTIDSSDWTGGSAQQIADRVIRGLRPKGTNIVLQHDGVTNSPNSARAVPLIVARARQRGYCFAELGARGRVAVPKPELRVRVVPGNEDGPTPVRVKLELDRPTTQRVSVRIQTVSGSAAAGSDFTVASRRVSFPRGVRTAWVTVPVLDDELVESVEDLRIVVSEPRGLRITRSELVATIFSDDTD